MKIILCCFLYTAQSLIYAQSSFNRFLTASDSFNKRKCVLASSFSAASYSVFSVGLYSAWYKKNNLGKFHTFNDWGEWKYMDKCGHLFSSFFQSQLIFQGSKWAGLSKRKSIFWSMGISTLFQTSIEFLDGFSSQYGFSWTDIGANVLGLGAFASQQMLWNEQRMQFKMSAHKINYNSSSSEIKDRITNFYSDNTLQRLLKDYNGQTYWISFHPVYAFTGQYSIWPDWLDLSLGYGVNGLYGGRSNSWFNTSQGWTSLPSNIYPRTNQYYLSLDLNLRKIPVKNRILKTCFFVLNIFKFPAPALELNSQGKSRFHWFLF